MWEKVKWGEVLDIRNGKNQKNVTDPSGKYPIYGSGGVMGYANDYLCPKGSTIIGRKGSINNPMYIDTDFWNVDTAFGLIAGDRLDNKFLYYFCTTYDFRKHDKSTTLPSLTKSDLLEIEIPLPPLPVQQRIADMLDKANALRRKDHEMLKKYDELAQAIFVDMFGDPVKNEKGWEVKSLGELCTKIGSGATPRGGKEAYKDEGISLIRSLNIHNNEFKMKDLAFIDDNQARQLRNVIVQEDDVLFNITGASVCRTSIVPKKILPARVNQHVAILRTNPQVLNPVYLVRLLTHRTFNAYLYNMAMQGGATREAITKDQLETLPIPLPPVQLQNQFREKIKIVNAVKIKSDTDKSEELFQSLLQRAFKSALVK